MRVRAIVASVMLLMMGDLCHGQSLADAARQNRLQKQKNGSSTKKVLTTDDLSPGADPKPPARAKAEPAKKDESKPEPYKTVGTAGFTPDMWVRTIKAQKDWVAHLQEAGEKVKTPPQFDVKNVANSPEARRQWEERGIQEQLASELPEQK